MKNRDIEVLKAKRDKLKFEARSIGRLIKDRKFVEQTIGDIHYLKKHAGRMVFTGQSGRKYDNENLREVYINGIAGCVAVPALLLDLAQGRLNAIDAEIDKLLERN